MPRRTTTVLILALALAALAGCVRPNEPGRGDVPFLETPGWKPGLGYSLGYTKMSSVSLKRERETAGALFLRHENLKKYWRYDPASRTLSAAAEEDWRRATGEVRNCLDPPSGACNIQLVTSTGPWRIRYSPDRPEANFGACPLSKHPETEQLVIWDPSGEDRLVPFPGDAVIDMRASPSQRMVAVHSGAGPRGSTGFSLSSTFQGHLFGQHYQQLYSLPEGEPLGKALRIPARLPRKICWSADEAFVVYVATTFHNMIFVHIREDTGL